MLPFLPQPWVVEAFGCMGSHIYLGLSPGGWGVVWRRPGTSGVCIDAWFPFGGCHPGYVGSDRVGKGGKLGMMS